MRHAVTSLIASIVVSMWCAGSQLSAAEENAGLSTPLSDMPQHFEEGTEQAGPLAGLWSALTGAPPATSASTPTMSGGKKAKPKPLSLRDYLNQQRDTSSDNSSLLRYGF